VRILCKLRIIYLLIFVLVAGCAGLNAQTCHPSNSPSCLNATEVWSNSINKVVAANFQDELGFYKPVVHKAKFSNAWVATGGEINITLSLLNRLNEVGRICVISHELAHLKSNHYYSKLGISTLTSAAMTLAGAFVPGLGYLDHVVNPAVTNTFGRQFELTADRLAVEYIKKTGLTKMDYLKFLYWMKENLGSSSKPGIASLFSTHPATQERINELLKG
jgi:Zn-dependent protease with chaperone function